MEQQLDHPEPSAAPEPRPSIEDITTQAMDIAGQRAADRAAGKDVPRELPKFVGRGGEALASSADRTARAAPRPAADVAPRSDASSASAAGDAPPASPAPAVEAPSGWADDRKASFGRLPPDTQRLVLEHTRGQDEDHARRSRDLQAQAAAATPFIKAYVDHHDYLDAQAARVGAPPHEIVSNVVSVLRALTTGTPQQRQQALAYVAYISGVDPRSLGA